MGKTVLHVRVSDDLRYQLELHIAKKRYQKGESTNLSAEIEKAIQMYIKSLEEEKKEQEN